ncbi:hypothetical protein N185_34535 [Sinorhizobium sp. GW3]|nr:hypothetical protein N185_34535 [Sinorhizobium sp. GW3]
MIVELTVAPFEQSRADVVGLLSIEPPNTHRQTFVGLGIESPDYEILSEETTGQRGYLFRGDFIKPRKIEYHFIQREAEHQAHIFTEFDNEYTHLDISTSELCASLSINPARGSVGTIAAAIARKFEYGPKNALLCTPRLFPGVAVGNCIDINTLFLACLRLMSHKAAYLAGYYFQPIVSGSVAQGIHCWVSVDECGELHDWDIAQCLQAGFGAPSNAPEPLGGIRAAFSYGRGLRFTRGGNRFSPLNHGARPHWLLADGKVIEAAVESKLLQISPVTEIGEDDGSHLSRREETSCVSVRSAM